VGGYICFVILASKRRDPAAGSHPVVVNKYNKKKSLENEKKTLKRGTRRITPKNLLFQC
jgi:hypothetical protein